MVGLPIHLTPGERVGKRTVTIAGVENIAIAVTIAWERDVTITVARVRDVAVAVAVAGVKIAVTVARVRDVAVTVVVTVAGEITVAVIVAVTGEITVAVVVAVTVTVTVTRGGKIVFLFCSQEVRSAPATAHQSKQHRPPAQGTDKT